jgi:hypothetical protein
MSPDEVIVTVAALFIGPVLWAVWLLRMSQLQLLGHRRAGVLTFATTLAGCVVMVFAVLKLAASHDVVDAPPYLFMYVVLGLAWLRVSERAFAFVGLSGRDDAIERGNQAALAAWVGGLVGVTLCYAGGNVGNGPGWWVVVFSAALATGTLLVAWIALSQFTTIADAVTIDRDPAAGLRLGAFLVSCGLILGEAVAGDWLSVPATVADVTAVLPVILLVFVIAVIVERVARPTAQRPHAPVVAYGLVPAALYVVIGIGTVIGREWPA